jgi:hypothetical protein
MYRVEPLLCDDGEIGKYTRPFSRQWPSKHVPTVMNRHATIEVLLQTVFTRSVLRKTTRAIKSVQYGKRTWAREDEESPLLEAVSRKRLMKKLQAGEDLACSDLQSVEISDSVIVICSYDL